MFLHDYPYTSFHELNLDYILKSVKLLNEKLENFVVLNTIKYADPIQWNITYQYEANTVVLDALTGTAYLSKQPVPSGVALTNSDYWQVIFTLDLLDINNNITLRDDGFNIVATFDSSVGDWLLWNNVLYRVTQAITINTAYVVGFNIERYTVELFIKDYITALNNIIGDLDDLTTTDKDSIVNAINEVDAALTTLETTVSEMPESFGIYDTFADVIANADNLNEGDIVQTKGYASIGIGAGVYIIHTSSAAYYIPCGSKYAELRYSDEIDIDALGADPSGPNTDVNCNVIETAIALAFHNKPMAPTTTGFYTGGSTIKFGAFTYKLTRPIVIPQDVSNLIFKGTNHNSLIWGAGSGTIFAIPQRSDSDYSLYWGFENLSFIGAMNAISFNKAGNIFIKDCAFFNTGNGIYFDFCVGVDVTDCTFVNCAIGTYIDNITTTVHISNSVYRSCSTGVYVTNGVNGVTIDSTIMEYCSSLAFYVYNSYNLAITESWIEANNATVLNSDIIAENVVNSSFPDLTPSVVTITNSSATAKTVNIKNVSEGTWAINHKFDGLINGSIEFTNGIRIDYSERKFIVCNASLVDISSIVSRAIGFLKVHSPYGNYFATLDFDYGNAMTITKIAGSLADPYSNTSGGISFVGLTAAETVIECEL